MKKYPYTKTFTHEGKRYYIRGNSLQECYEKIARKKMALENGEKHISKNMRFDEWAEDWLKTYKERTVSPETLDSYRSNIRVHILPVLGSMPMRSIRPVHCQRVINNLSGNSAKMISRVSQLMFSIFDAAVDNNLILDNPAKKIRKPKGTKKTRRAITQEERAVILKVAETNRAGTWILLMLMCGLRPAEAAALRWQDVDIKNKLLTVNHAVKRAGGVGSPKSSAGQRTIPIPDALLSQLEPKEPNEYVCTNSRGGRLTSTSMQRQWDYFKNEMNIEMGCQTSPHGRAIPPYRVASDLVPYCLRHTYCTDLRDSGVDITVAKVLMGHSSIAVTAQIYTHQTEAALKDAAEKINSMGATLGATSQPPSTALDSTPNKK